MHVAGRIRATAPMAMLGLLLAGCGSHPRTGAYYSGGNQYVAGHPMYRVGEPYKIKGVWYYPAVDYNYDKTGIASWYGEQFDGRYTADGEIFNLNQLTAAHTTLPMPSIVQVTNLDNGRSLQLRVNDRGPFVDGRLIDVSRRAAQLLGFETKGTAPVEVKIIKDASIRVAEEAMHGSGGAVLVAQLTNAPTKTMALPAPQPYAAPGAPPSALTHNVVAGPIVDTQTAALPPPAPAPNVVAGPIVDTRTAALPPSAPAPNVVAGPIVDTRTAALPPSAPAPNVVAGPIGDTQMPTSPPRIAAIPGGSSPGRIFVQAGAFSVRDNAQRVQSRIAPLGSVRVMTASVKGAEVYRVRLGPVESVEQADRLLQRVVNSGYPGARIVTD
jgi:peptidoglycan lytic transglycosylase